MSRQGFVKAVKQGLKLRMAIIGPPGSGKTYSGLRIMRALVGDKGRIAFIDTEHESATKYADDFDFDVIELDTYSPEELVELVSEAQAQGYDGLIVDSFSHFWMGTEGIIDQVDKQAKRKQYGSNFAAWKDVNPREKKMWDALLSCGMHLILNLRTKTEYVMDEVESNGKKRTVPRKIGLAPIMRDGLEYEADVVGEMNMDHELIISKTRCKDLVDKVFRFPGEDVAKILLPWLGTVEAATEAVAKVVDKVAEKVAEHKQDDSTELRKEMAGYLKIIGITKDIGAFLCGVRGHKSTSEMSLDVLKEFVADLCDVSGYVERSVIPKEVCLDMLQRNDGSDPIKHVIEACKAAEAEAVEV